MIKRWQIGVIVIILLYGLIMIGLILVRYTAKPTSDIELIIGNSNHNFSGGTSITLQLLPYQAKLIDLAVLGKKHIPPSFKTLNILDFITLRQLPLANGKPRVLYTRRNDEMIQGLIARDWLGSQIKIVFSSAAQRKHTWLTRWLMRQMDSIVATSEKSASFLPSKPDLISPHGINTKQFFPPTSKALAWKKLGYPGTIGIGLFGRVRQSKGVDLLVDAAITTLKNYPDVTVLIVGETQSKDRIYQQKLQSTITQSGFQSRILFIGKRPFSELPKLFQGVSIVAALSRNEGYGLTPLEGMASGAAVLTSHAGIWPEIVKEGIHGHVVPTSAPHQIQQALASLLKNPKKTATMGKNGAKTILNHFDIQQEAKRIVTHIKHLQNR